MTSHACSSDEPRPKRKIERIDRVCLDFEDAWQAGRNPQIADFLQGWQGAERSELLRELLIVEVEYVRKSGREPAADEYLDRFPDDRNQVAEVFGIPFAHISTGLAAGQAVGRYVVERLLGSGSFGCVYLAWDGELERSVALKVPQLIQDGRVHSVDEFIEEARTASKIDHPAIVPVLDVVRDARGMPVIVMPYIEGCSLRDRMTERKLAHAEALGFVIEIADAMDYAHRRGFIHRDLKPRNILLDSDGRPHITDFGLALHESTQRRRAGESAGSLAYMSPEQLRGEAHWLDGRSDIWALGVVLYELLTGRRPFGGRTPDEVASEIFARDPKPPRQIDAEIPVELERICLVCLSKSPGGRFATARDLADALRGVARTVPTFRADTAGVGIARQPATAAPLSRILLPIAGILVALVSAVSLAIGLGAFGARPSSSTSGILHNIELSVWSPGDELRGRINRYDQSASPLYVGDKIRLAITSSRPAFLYVLWIGTDGDVTPIYPWPAATWNRPSVETATDNVRLPAAPNQTWQVQPGESGVETIIVFVADKPLPVDLDFASLVTAAHSQAGMSLDEPLWFDQGQLQPSQRSDLRSPDVIRPVALENALITNQLLIADKLGRYCLSFHALCIPISGS